MMLAHIDDAGGCFDRSERGFDDGFRLPYKCDDCAVRGCARVNMEQLDAGNAFDFTGDLADDAHIASFAEVRDAFQQALGGYIALPTRFTH